MSSEIWSMDAHEQALRIRSRELSPVEVLDAHLDRIDAVNPLLNAVVTFNDEARDQARTAEAAVMASEPLGPLHGVPFTVKDSFDTAGLRTTRGSLLFDAHVPAADATVVARMRGAGAVLLGKTNVPEFVLWAETDNRVFGPTVNPWDPDRTPGGSSGGEAAAIAAGLSPLGIGSDLSGSIRLPAHHCGIVGLKPTHGRVPMTGHWPETLQQYTHVGPLARSVRDVRLALSVIEGPDLHDWYSQHGTPAARRKALEDLRVGWVAGESFGPLDSDVAAAVEAAAQALGGVAASVTPVSVAVLDDTDFDLLTMDLYGAGGASFFDGVIGGRTDMLHEVLRVRLAHSGPGLAEYLAAEETVSRLRAELTTYFRDRDVLICPVVPVPAPLREQPFLRVGDRDMRSRSVLRATIPFDLSGHPAVSVPFGRSSEGLPIGVQVVGRRFADDTVLDVAEWLVQYVGQEVVAEPDVARFTVLEHSSAGRDNSTSSDKQEG
jgi:Asp-tRNA(Asn)/Glu-tRNA(Gln) amidotransferase A subunit family amidase